MKNWMCPRVVFSLSLGLVVGLLMWMLPPLPRWTFTLEGPLMSNGHRFAIQTVSSDGRYIIVHHRTGNDGPAVMAVWDHQKNLQVPWISHSVNEGFWLYPEFLLSPDESTFVSAISRNGRPVNFRLYDLTTGLMKNEYQFHANGYFFSPEGTLLSYCNYELFDVETGEVVRRLPEVIDGFKFKCYAGPYVILKKGRQRRVYSWLTGKIAAEMTLPYEELEIYYVSKDGLTVECSGSIPSREPTLHIAMDVLIDSRSGVCFSSKDRPFSFGPIISPDGGAVVRFDQHEPYPWISRIWKSRAVERCLCVIRRNDALELGRFPNVKHACFSPKGNLLATVRNDNSIAVYDFPFGKPWGLIVGAAVITAVCISGLASVWSNRERHLHRIRSVRQVSS